MTWLVLVVLGLGTYRATRLIVVDEVTAPLRHAVARRYPPTTRPNVRKETGAPIPDTGTVTPHWTVALLNCEWCTGLWVSAALVLGAHFAGLIGPWRWTGFAWPAVATIAGALKRWIDS